MEGDCTKTLFITANIASIFEEPDTLFPIWLKAFYQCIQTNKPGFLAIHCQEVGGKNYEESMQNVNHFINFHPEISHCDATRALAGVTVANLYVKTAGHRIVFDTNSSLAVKGLNRQQTLLGCEELHRYDRARIFLDEDYTASDKFTALGNIYFIHEEVMDVLIWDFVDCMFVEVEGREVLSGNIENVPIKEKAKFPQYFFPEFKWSRKGFLRTRWSINNCIFDLINIHLFHDASNIIAMESSPSIYSNNRQRAFMHTLQRFENDKYSKVPFFIFGDFNFRLDANRLIQELTQKLVSNQVKGKKDQVKKIEYSEEGNGKTVLTIESKFFDYYDKHTDLFANMNKWVHQFDNELSQYRDRLYEFDVSFPPSYPFCEGLADGISYMKTRVPAWCDRILLSHSVKDILSQDPSHKGEYNIIGKGICMGDHKPVYLFVHMKPGKGKLEKQVSQDTTPAPRSTSSSISEHSRPRTLSINGEPINFSASSKVDLAVVNIHDYAVFEKEQELIPEFRASIKSRNAEEGDGSGHISAKEAVKKVIAMEKVLLKWPTRRSRTRHHSSSSEDLKSDDDSESVASSHKSDVNSVVHSTASNTQSNKVADENEISISLNEANNNNNNNAKSSKTTMNAGELKDGDTGKGSAVNVFDGSDTRDVSHVASRACHPSDLSSPSSSSSPPSSSTTTANPEGKGKVDGQSSMSSNKLTQPQSSPTQQQEASSNSPPSRCCSGCVLL